MIEIRHIDDGKKGGFQAFENGIQVGEMTYVWNGDKSFTIDHTETFEGNEGKGIGKSLVLAGVAFAREKGVKIVPHCSFAKRILTMREEYSDVL